MDQLIELAGQLAAIVTPIVGTVAVLAGIIMAYRAFQDARADAAKARKKTGEAGAFDVIPDKALEILPELVKSAAGIAIAVMLLGVFLLLGALFSNDAANPGSSPSPSPAAITRPLSSL